MKDRIVLVDFAGTLIRSEIIEEANQFRSEILKRSLPSKKEHAEPDELYKDNRKFVGKLTGLKEDMSVQYRKNDLERMKLSGKQLQNQIATNLFQIGMYRVAKKHKKNIFPVGLIEQLNRIKKLGYKLAIVSGVREDIISGMLKISGNLVEFDYIYGQPPILGVSNEENIKELAEQGIVEYVIGDKLNDLEAGKFVGAKTIFAKWGHASGGEEEFADYSVDKAEDLNKIIK